MNSRAQDFLQRLEQLEPETNDNLVADLYELTESLETDPSAPELFEAMFAFMEMHPGADFGVPGPLVHLIEQHRRDYDQLLAASVLRAPMYTTLHMVNRLLNVAQFVPERERWLSTLQTVVGNSSFSDDARKLAEQFLEFQNSKG